MISEGTTPDPEGYKPMTLTGEYLIEEIHRFRREFWLTTVTNEQRDEAIKALTFVYLNVDPESENADVATDFFISTVDENSKRCAHFM